MTIHEARQIARQVEAGKILVLTHDENFDRVREALHKLDQSDPTTVERRREDMRLRDVIWHAAGKGRSTNLVPEDTAETGVMRQQVDLNALADWAVDNAASSGQTIFVSFPADDIKFRFLNLRTTPTGPFSPTVAGH